MQAVHRTAAQYFTVLQNTLTGCFVFLGMLYLQRCGIIISVNCDYFLCNVLLQ